MDIEALMDMYACNCGRSGCGFFAPGAGDEGSSFSRATIEYYVKELPKLQKHFEALLASPQIDKKDKADE